MFPVPDIASGPMFTVGQFVVNGVAYEVADLHVEMLVKVERPGILARVQVDGRGSAVQLVAVAVGDGHVEVWLASSGTSLSQHR